jgi:hypothetical protein
MPFLWGNIFFGGHWACIFLNRATASAPRHESVWTVNIGFAVNIYL